MTVLTVLVLLVILPAIVAVVSERSLLPRVMIPAFTIGTRVVYQRQGVSNRPIAGARDIRPSERGEFYYYSLVNYLRVTQVLDDGRVIAIARDNKRLCFWPNDSQLRKARLAERLIHRSRFPSLAAI